jgi:phosphoribosylformylglycinamidine cyclo-ligase
VTSAGEYAAAGVDLARADEAKARIGAAVAGTRTALSVGRVGAFGGMVRVPAGLRKPTLVLSTDGVGTKVLVALQAGRFDTVGEDLVNHSVNDILVHGATPVAFMDYVAGDGLGVEQIAGLVEGIARACRSHGMALAGGETAQMPGLYRPGTYDLAGTIIGVVEEDEALHGDAIVPGDVLLGYASTGLHTNGYTLARRILFDRLGLGVGDPLGETGRTVGDALLAVHQSYFRSVMPVIRRIHGLAHITGGGIAGNLVRVLPERCEAVVDPNAWAWPPLFTLLQQAGSVSTDEMREVFNLGIGLVAVLPGDAVEVVQRAARDAGVATRPIGEVRRGAATAVRFAEP